MKNLVILSGGGFKASYQVGALKALREHSISIDCIMGTSGGALNSAMIASNKTTELLQVWNNLAKNGITDIFESTYIDLSTLKLNIRTVIKHILPSIGLNIFTKKGLNDFKTVLSNNLNDINYLATSKGLKNLLLSHINIKDITIPFYFNFVSLSSGKEIVTSKEDYILNEEFINGIVASASIPLFLDSQKVFTSNAVYENCVDGGVSSNVLINKAIKYIKSCEDSKDWRIIIINCNSNNIETVKRFNGLVSIFERVVLGLMLNTLTKKDINTLDAINELTNSSNGKYLSVPYIHIFPPVSDIGNTMEINETINKYRIVRGYEDTNKILKSNLQ